MTFRLTTLGELSLQDAATGRRLAVPRKALAAMAILASAGTKGASRERIVSLLWPGSVESGRGALKQTIYELRQTLGNQDIVSGTADLWLDPTQVTSDVADLERAHAAGDWAGMAQLYGGPFLDRFTLRGAPEFERWTESRRSYYAELFRRAA